jgi:hypothetical protein
MKTWAVKVIQAEGNRTTTWFVKASTQKDAEQLAFALDGRWGKEKDARDMLALAQTYSSAIPKP